MKTQDVTRRLLDLMEAKPESKTAQMRFEGGMGDVTDVVYDRRYDEVVIYTGSGF